MGTFNDCLQCVCQNNKLSCAPQFLFLNPQNTSLFHSLVLPDLFITLKSTAIDRSLFKICHALSWVAKGRKSYPDTPGDSDLQLAAWLLIQCFWVKIIVFFSSFLISYRSLYWCVQHSWKHNYPHWWLGNNTLVYQPAPGLQLIFIIN